MSTFKLTPLLLTVAMTSFSWAHAAEAEQEDNPQEANEQQQEEAGAANAPSNARTPPKFRNLFQACRITMSKLCTKKDLQTFSLKCLKEKKEKGLIKDIDPVCDEALGEYDSCTRDPELIKCQQEGKKLLRKGPTQNKCLLKIANTDGGAALSAVCRSSQYFQSLLKFSTRKEQLQKLKKDKAVAIKIRMQDKRAELKELKKQAKLKKVETKES